MADSNSIIQQHRAKPSRTYNAWAGMRQRCINPNHHKYYLYGERGIKVCAEWDSFDRFLADMGSAPEGCTLDRKDNDLGYFKDNCRWATVQEQNRNRRTALNYTYKGETHCLVDWAKKLWQPYSKLYWRLVQTNKPWSVDDAFSA